MMDLNVPHSPNASFISGTSPRLDHSTGNFIPGNRFKPHARTRFSSASKIVTSDTKIETAVLSEVQSDPESEYANEYFDQDYEDNDDDQAKMKRINRERRNINPYSIFFKPYVFLEFFLYHFIYFFILGPFIVILAPIIGLKIIQNQRMIGFNFGSNTQFIQYAAIISFGVTYYLGKIKDLQATELYMLITLILLRIITISTKYAYKSDIELQTLHNKKISEKELTNDLIAFRWESQTDEVIEEELQTAIMRIELDSKLFFFEFAREISPNLQAKLGEPKLGSRSSTLQLAAAKDYDNKTSSNRGWNIVKNISRNSISPSSPSSPSAIIKDALSAKASEIFKTFTKYLTVKKLKGHQLYGYNLILDLILQAKKLRFKRHSLIVFALSILRASAPTLYRVYLVYYKKEDVRIFTSAPYVIVFLFLLNLFYFWVNVRILFISVLDMSAQIFCIKQIGHLISPKKIVYFRDKKLYPTLNIFDPVTLKTWINLRRIAHEYGKKYIGRNNANISITLIFYAVILVILILQSLGVILMTSDPLLLGILIFESAIFCFIFIKILIGTAFINNQFKVHKYLLKRNKIVVSDLVRLSYLYAGKNAIKPDNYIYRQALKILKQELGEEDFKEKLEERCETLVTMIDEAIEELDFEEENEPATMLGIHVNYTLLNSMLLGVVSILFAIIQRLLNLS